MSGSNAPRVVFAKTFFRSWSGQNIPWPLRILFFLLWPFFLLFVLGFVLLGFCVLATTLLIHAVRYLVLGTSTTKVWVLRRNDLSGQPPSLNHSGSPRGPIIDILPEPGTTPDRR